MDQSDDKTVGQVPNSYWARLKVFLFDTAILSALVVLLRLLWPYMVGCEFAEVRHFVKVHAKIVKWCICPLTGLIVALLFRDVLMSILYQLPAFVHRSQYGKRDVCQSKKKKEPPSSEDAPSDVSGKNELGHEVDSQGQNLTIKQMTCEEGQRAVELALRNIAAEYRCELKRESCIRGTSYIFDGIMQDDDAIYGVEVKCGYNRNSIKRALREFAELAAALPLKVHDAFTPILCVVAQQPNAYWRDELMQIVADSKVRVILRMYSLQELSQEKEGCIDECK